MGLLVPLLALVVTLVLTIVGGLLGVSFIDQLSGVTLPQNAQQKLSRRRAAEPGHDPDYWGHPGAAGAVRRRGHRRRLGRQDRQPQAVANL